MSTPNSSLLTPNFLILPDFTHFVKSSFCFSTKKYIVWQKGTPVCESAGKLAKIVENADVLAALLIFKLSQNGLFGGLVKPVVIEYLSHKIER